MFIRNAQMDNCSRLVVVPLSVFHRMAESIVDPESRIVLLFNTGRCGSTLLTKVINWEAEPENMKQVTRRIVIVND